MSEGYLGSDEKLNLKMGSGKPVGRINQRNQRGQYPLNIKE